MNWIVEPKSPLVFGDGRSIGNIGGVRSLELPWPSTLAGMVRTLAGSTPDTRFDTDQIDRVLNISVRGPWLYSQTTQKAYFPTPIDMVWNQDANGQESYTCTRLVSSKIDDVCPEAIFDEGMNSALHIVVPQKELPEGKNIHGPMFWSKEQMNQWLCSPKSMVFSRKEAGLWTLLHDQRTHVAIDGTTKTATDGSLFSTDGVVFSSSSKEEFSIAFSAQDDSLTQWQDKPCFLGGERRLAHLRAINHEITPSAELVQALIEAKSWRVILITPALFSEGAQPKEIWNQQVQTCVVGRPVALSGWDYVLSAPKPSRRMVPAGSVYWINVANRSADQKKKLLFDSWMTSCSTQEQDQKDGFGISLLGVG